MDRQLPDTAANLTSTAVSANAIGPGARNASGTSIHAHRAAVATASSTRPQPPGSRTASLAAARTAAGQSVSDSGRAQALRPTTRAPVPIAAATTANSVAPGSPAPASA